MRRQLMTRYGFDYLQANGVSTEDIQRTTCIVPVPTHASSVKLGAGVSLCRHGETLNHVVIGDADPIQAWVSIGLTPIIFSSVLARNMLGKKKNSRVKNENGEEFLIVDVFAPDTSGETIYEHPEQVSSIC